MRDVLLLALAASVPLAVLGLIAGALTERLGAGLRTRAMIWSLALFLPMTLAPVFIAVQALDIRSPIAVVRGSDPAPAPVASAPAPAFEPQIATQPVSPPVASPLRIPFSASQIALMLVLAGAALCWAALIVRFRRLHGLLARARAAPASEALARQAAAFGLKPPALRIDASGATPLLAGWRRPVILLPEALLALPADRLALVLGHELAHLKRGDNLKMLAEEVLLGLFWFNPLLRLARLRLSAVREERCDALALAQAHGAERKAYAQTLVQALKGEANPAPALAFIGARGALVRRRLLAILHPRRGSPLAAPLATVFSVALLGAAGAASLAMAASPPMRQAAADLVAGVANAGQGRGAGFAALKVQARRAPPPASAREVRFEMRMLGGTDRVYSDLLNAPRGEGWAFLLEPTLHSTYEDGPTVRLSSEVDLDATLASFSPNELRWRKLPDIATANGTAVVLDSTALFGPQYQRMVANLRVIPAMQLVSLAPDSATGAPARPDQYVIAGFTTVGPAPSGAAGGAPRTLPYVPGGLAERALAFVAPQTTISLKPTLRANGKIALEITARTVTPERPVLRLVEGPAADERDNIMAELIAVRGQPGAGTRKLMHYEQTGVRPAENKVRTSILEVSDRQVIAIPGISSGDLPGGGTLLLRPILGAAPRPAHAEAGVAPASARPVAWRSQEAGPSASPVRPLAVALGSSVTVTLPTAARRVIINKTGVVELRMASPTSVQIHGVEVGEMKVQFQDDHNGDILALAVTVSQPAPGNRSALP